MKNKVLLPEPINQKGIELITSKGYEVVMGTGISEDVLIREAKDCDGILIRNAKITEKVMKSCNKLKVVSMHGVGVDSIDIETATKLNIQITNAANSNQSSVAEYTIGLLLMLAKNSVIYNNGLKQGNLDVRKMYGCDVCGKTLGIIGMGNIGTQVAKMAYYGLHMNVIGYSRHIMSEKKTEFGLLTNQMEKVISTADFLSLHLPGGDSTNKLIGERELSLMKSEAFLINTGRGEVIDEAALIKMLQNGKIKGAALDVFEGNYPKSDNPLLRMDHVIVSPHTAAFTNEALERMAYQAALGIVEVLEGQPVTYPVNTVKTFLELNKKISAIV